LFFIIIQPFALFYGSMHFLYNLPLQIFWARSFLPRLLRQFLTHNAVCFVVVFYVILIQYFGTGVWTSEVWSALGMRGLLYFLWSQCPPTLVFITEPTTDAKCLTLQNPSNLKSRTVWLWTCLERILTYFISCSLILNRTFCLPFPVQTILI
jgi:hypothetical protein